MESSSGYISFGGIITQNIKWVLDIVPVVIIYNDLSV